MANVRSPGVLQSAPGYYSAVMQDGPVIYLRLNEASGYPQDFSGNGYNVSVVGGTPVYHVAGAVGDGDYAMTLDGASEYLSVPGAPGIDFGDGPLSIEFWAKRATGSASQVEPVFCKNTGGPSASFSASEKFSFGKQGVDVIVQETGTTTDTDWHHWVVTKNGATSIIYKDGDNVTGTIDNYTLASSAGALELGREGAYYFPGTLDEIAFYSTVLGQARVQAHFTAATGGSGPPVVTAQVIPFLTDRVYSPVVSGPPGGSAVYVSSIASLKEELLDNSNTEIVLTDGTYSIDAAGLELTNSLWIGSDYASRTTPVLVRAETVGGVTLSRGGGSMGGITFSGGAHHQTWQGFVFANGNANQTGVVMIGGWADVAAPHDLALDDISVLSSVTGTTTGHAIYFSMAADPGPYNITVDGLDVDGAGGLYSAFHFYHSQSGSPNAGHVTISNLTATNLKEAIMLWDSTLHDITIENSVITDSLYYAVRYEQADADNDITLDNVDSTGSGEQGFFSSYGAPPVTGLTINGNCSLA